MAPGVITAFWAMETDFGAVQGNLPVVRSVATLAYDCRRSEKFKGELFAALRVLERGDLSPAQLRGTTLTIGVALGEAKAQAIIGAVRAGLVSALATNTRTAEAVLDTLRT